MNCALITGASKGIGRAIALQLSADHALHILINYNTDDQAAAETLEMIELRGGSGSLLKFDVANKTQTDNTLDFWHRNNQDKHITVLVNNAGITRDSLFYWMTETHWNEVMHVNVNGMFNVTQHVIKHMLKNKWGRIINITSVSGQRGAVGQTNYSAAKAGLIGATKALALEVAKMHITVNAVAPGFIETEMLDTLDMKKHLNSIPMRRIGTGEEVAHLVSFLASERSSYITGEVININGGLYT